MTVAAGALLASFSAGAEDGNWMVRARAVHVGWAQESSPVGALAVPANGIHLENKTIPEVDISYFFTKNLAAELILTYPQGDKAAAAHLKKGLSFVELGKKPEALAALKILVAKYPLEEESKIAQEKIRELTEK